MEGNTQAGRGGASSSNVWSIPNGMGWGEDLSSSAVSSSGEGGFGRSHVQNVLSSSS